MAFVFYSSFKATMSDQGDKACPLCAEEMDLTDQQLKPCKCGYQVCNSSNFLHSYTKDNVLFELLIMFHECNLKPCCLC